jgi:Cu2+-exporting ATPase
MSPEFRGIAMTAEDGKLNVPTADNFRAITGKGVAASVDGVEYHMGGPALLKAEDAQVQESTSAQAPMSP